jgi:hypothetical protein
MPPPFSLNDCVVLCFRSDLMSKAPWNDFHDLQPRSHLLVGVMPADRFYGTGELRIFQNVLLRLLRKQNPSARYSATVVRDAGRTGSVFCFREQG